MDQVKTLFMLSLVLGALAATFLLDPSTLRYLSYPCAVMLLCGKLLPVFIQGPSTRKLGVLLSAQEANFEATFQLVLVANGVFFYNHTINISTYSAVISSLLTISRAGIEKLLVFGDGSGGKFSPEPRPRRFGHAWVVLQSNDELEMVSFSPLAGPRQTP